MAGDFIRMEGKIVKAVGNGRFMVALEGDEEKQIICTLNGKINHRTIKTIEGDLVDVDISPYDLTKGRIVYIRKKNARK